MAEPSSRAPIPITIITGFAGAGKTTLILHTLPQLRRTTPGYRLALIKNEIGDVAVDSALAASAELTASRELLGDCICCTNVGQVGDALAELTQSSSSSSSSSSAGSSSSPPDRIVIETSGSAEPLKLALEVKRLARETGGAYLLDGVVSVIDAENWAGYANTSFTAKLQAQQTDLIVINKWEGMGEREFDVFLDRLGDLDVDTPQVKSDRGRISVDVLFGFDEKMARGWLDGKHGHDHHAHEQSAGHTHQSEVECVSVTLKSDKPGTGVDLKKLDGLLRSAPKDEVYRIKALLYSTSSPKDSEGTDVAADVQGRGRYILNWSFGRWTWARDNSNDEKAPALRMSIFTAPYESNKWIKKIESGPLVGLEEGAEGQLEVKRVQ